MQGAFGGAGVQVRVLLRPGRSPQRPAAVARAVGGLVAARSAGAVAVTAGAEPPPPGQRAEEVVLLDSADLPLVAAEVVAELGRRGLLAVGPWVYSEAEEAAVADRLRALGYLE